MINRVRYYYFSPTNTTKKIVEKVGQGIGKEVIEENITFIEKNKKEYINEKSVLCKKCWKICPVDAIDSDDPKNVAIEKCIHCYACIMICGFGGREVVNNPVQPIIEMLESKFTARKEPELFL